MHSKRKELVKAKKRLARRMVWDRLAAIKKAEYMAHKLRSRLQPNTFRVTFAFSPDELGIECKPTQEDIDRLGLKRAEERLNRSDFYTHISIIAKGTPDSENLSRLRQQVLMNTKFKFDPNGITDINPIENTGDLNETEPGTITTTEL